MGDNYEFQIAIMSNRHCGQKSLSAPNITYTFLCVLFNTTTTSTYPYVPCHYTSFKVKLQPKIAIPAIISSDLVNWLPTCTAFFFVHSISSEQGLQEANSKLVTLLVLKTFINNIEMHTFVYFISTYNPHLKKTLEMAARTLRSLLLEYPRNPNTWELQIPD